MTVLVETDRTKEKVRNGAAYLDEHVPGWRYTIDADRIDIGSRCDCVLGQLLGDFYELPRLGMSFSSVVRLGFDTDDGDRGVQELNQAWRDELNQED